MSGSTHRLRQQTAFAVAAAVLVWSPADASLGVHGLSLTFEATAMASAQAMEPASATTAGTESDCETRLDTFTSRQYRAIKVHKACAFTTAGLVLAVDGMGLYHFLRMKSRGHEIRDSLGYTEANYDPAVQAEQLQRVWRESESQTERVIHGGLVALAMVSYTTTATIELTMPRTRVSTTPVSKTRLHKYLFWVHAGLMAANVGLGFLESYSLSTGDHAAVQAAGIAHLVVGFSVPVVMVASGLVYKLPLEY